VRIFLFLATLTVLAAPSAADSRGIPPRVNRTQYPITCFTDKVAIGAALLAPDQVRLRFGPEAEKRYLVVEVGVYPKLGTIELKTGDFALRLVGPQTLTKPVEASALEQNGGSAAKGKTLPEIGTAKPVGGYLFFAAPDPPVYTAYELDYTGDGSWLTLPLTPKRR
jgi:hypothetical protein